MHTDSKQLHNHYYIFVKAKALDFAMLASALAGNFFQIYNHNILQKCQRRTKGQKIIGHAWQFLSQLFIIIGVYKKIESRAKNAKKSCGILGEWAKSIKNHIYWIARSSKGNQPMVKAKWSAMANHVINVHEGHHSLFPKCLHNDLEDRVWITPGIFNTVRTRNIIFNPYFMNYDYFMNLVRSYH